MDKLTLNGYLKKVEADAKTKDNYRERYGEVRDKIATRWFNVRATNRIVVYLKIPSEHVSMNYDVLVEFEFGRNNGSYKKFMTDDIRVFSNCPSFVFMNARVFDRKGFLIPWAKKLYDKATLEEPIDKAKQEEDKKKDVRYEKSLYFTALYFESLNPIEVLSEIKGATNVPRVESIVQYMKSPEKTMQVRTKKSEKQKSRTRTVIASKKKGIEEVNKSNVHKVSKINKVTSVSSVKKIKHI